MKEKKSPILTKTVALGAGSAVLYFLLYLFEQPLMKLAQQGHWYFIVPIVIAFVFSWIHGNFTGLFWDVLGVKAKSVKK